MEIIMKRIFYIFYLLVILILIVPGQKKADALSNLENAPRVAAVLPSRDNLFWSDVWASLQKNMPYASFHLTEYDYEISDTSDTKTLLQLLDLVENVSPNGLILAPHVTPSAPLYQKLKALREKGGEDRSSGYRY